MNLPYGHVKEQLTELPAVLEFLGVIHRFCRATDHLHGVVVTNRKPFTRRQSELRNPLHNVIRELRNTPLLVLIPHAKPADAGCEKKIVDPHRQE
jgi:hypothetical protein